jgi:hypothetical protein
VYVLSDKIHHCPNLMKVEKCLQKITAYYGILLAEIRPAPHMDNLVAVFKSMEAAAGISVVSTQLTPAPKAAGN